MELPDDLVIACPLESDWTMDTVDPYCPACWDDGVEVLDVLSGEHKGVGDSKDKSQSTKQKTTSQKSKKPKSNKQQVKKPKSNKQQAKNQNVKKKKKQLGGLQGPLPPSPPPVIRWKV